MSLRRIRDLALNSRGRAFEEFILQVLNEAGAVIEESPRNLTGRRAGAVAVIPGEELSLGLILVEAKVTRSPESANRAMRRLGEIVVRQNASLGLLIYDPASPFAIAQEIAPRVVPLAAEKLIEELSQGSLADVLTAAREAAIDEM